MHAPHSTFYSASTLPPLSLLPPTTPFHYAHIIMLMSDHQEPLPVCRQTNYLNYSGAWV